MSKPVSQDFDVFIPREVSEDGKLLRGVRRRPDGERPCVVRALRDGMPMTATSEVARFRRRQDEDHEAYDIETLYSPGGPPRVASDAYRAGYDAINWHADKPTKSAEPN